MTPILMKKEHLHQQHALQLACPPLPVVRIGFIGLGNRGMATLKRYLVIDGVTIKVLCDLSRHHLEEAQTLLLNAGHSAADLYNEPTGWKELCKRDDIDLIYICTDWLTHTPMAVFAMQHGKHVAIEVPAATSIDECWLLVDTAEQTQRHCYMLENCCYDPFSMSAFTMERQGVFGDITHCEGAYIHDLRDKYTADERNGGYHDGWMARFCNEHSGNPYPTHGIGPICQLLHIHRGDRLDYLVSLSPDTGKGRTQGVYMNNTLIRTVGGKSILLQYDVSTPRPYSRMQTICGTKGFIQKYPRRCLSIDGQEPVCDNDIEPILRNNEHPLTAPILRDGEQLNVPNIMNYTMDRRLIHCLRKGLPLDIDVYDAAEWSCLTELSEQSARNGSRPVKIPDFTRGRWNLIKGYDFSADTPDKL